MLLAQPNRATTSCKYQNVPAPIADTSTQYSFHGVIVLIFPAMKNYRNRSILLVIAMLAVMGWIIVAADKGALPPFITALYAFPNGDKVGHFLLMGGLALGLNLLLSMRSVTLFSRSVLLGTLLVLIGVTLEEFSQMIFQTRTFSMLDLGFSYLGILAADIVVRRLFM